MFAFLRGTIADRQAGTVALDVHGVGYHVLVPDRVAQRLQPHQEVTLLTYCHIREDAFQIFGFLQEDERRLFITLLGVTGVGPKAALAVLSVLSPAAMGQAVQQNDVNAISKAPGVGKKSAQRIILEMKSKMGQDAELSAILGEAPADADGSGDDVYEALISLGCSPSEARRAANGARKKLGDDAAPEALVTAALQSLAR